MNRLGRPDRGPAVPPADAWKSWGGAPLPMSDRAVARLVQARAAAAGHDSADYGGHSLRAEFLTAAARTGMFKMCKVKRHESMQLLVI